MPAKITLKLDEKQEKCLLILDENIKSCVKDDILAELQNQGIKFGINEQVIDDVLEGKYKLLDKIVIAENIQSSKGENGSLVYLISDKIEIKSDEKGRVDFYDVSLIKNVLKGDKLVEIIPPKPGKPGKTMFGEEIPGILGQLASFNKILGRGTDLDPDKKFVIAAVDGVYNKNVAGLIAVVSELTIKGDLNFGVGNVDTSSAITITGDVKAGFKCRSASSIVIEGVIEDALVESGENLICRQGILPGENKISAKETLKTRYIRNRTDVECKNLIVEEMIANCTVRSLGKVDVKKIVGGHISIKSKLTVEELGNDQYAPTYVEIGINYKIIARMNEIRLENARLKKESEDKKEEVNNNEIEYKKVSRRINQLLESGDSASNKATIEKIALEAKELTTLTLTLNTQIEEGNRQIEKNLKEYDALSKKAEEESPELIVTGTIYPNVFIRIRLGMKYEVQSIMHKVKLVPDESGNVRIIKM